MAIRYGFFDAVKSGTTYDRVYSSENFCDYLGSIVGNGIQDTYGDALEVSLNDTADTFVISSGKAWIDGHYLIVDDDGFEFNFTNGIIPASGYYGYAILCAYLESDSRAMGFHVVAGNTAALDTDTPPEMRSDGYTADKDGITYTDSAGVRWIPIAAAKIEYGSVYATDIVDMRDGRYMQCILGKCPQKLEAITTLENTVADLQEQIDAVDAEIEKLSNEMASQITEMQGEFESLSAKVETLEFQSTLLSQAVGENSIAAVYANGCTRVFGGGELTTPLNQASIACLVETIATSGGDLEITFDSGITSICAEFSNLLYTYFSTQVISSLPVLIIPGTVVFIGVQALCSPNVEFKGTMASWESIQMDGDATITASVFSALLDTTTVRITCMDGILAWNSETGEWEEQ